jgi:flagellar motility protein MotE (MotC chaperone)
VKGLLPALLGGTLYAMTGMFVVVHELSKMPELGGEPPKEKTALPPRLWNFNSDAVTQLIADVKTGREKVSTDEKSLVTLKSQLDSEKAELVKLRAEIEGMRKEIEERVLEIQDNEIKNLKTLAQTYSTMPAPQAVSIFREMDDNTVVKVLACMKADKTGPILGEMSKAQDKQGEENMAKRAARISDKLRLIKPLKKETPA